MIRVNDISDQFGSSKGTARSLSHACLSLVVACNAATRHKGDTRTYPVGWMQLYGQLAVQAAQDADNLRQSVRRRFYDSLGDPCHLAGWLDGEELASVDPELLSKHPESFLPPMPVGQFVQGMVQALFAVHPCAGSQP